MSHRPIIVLTLKTDMQENTNTQPTDDSQITPIQPPTLTGGKKIIQPSSGFVQELQTQQQQPIQPTVVTTESSQLPQTTQSAPTYNQPTFPADTQMQGGMSASQMGLNQPNNKLFDFNLKTLIIKGVVGFVVLGGIFAVLVATNIIALSQFKTVEYTNSSGTHYNLTFYTKHGTKTLSSDNTALVSKVSEGGKYPLTLSIANSDASGYARLKDCDSVSLSKAFDVQNNNLNQKIAVCSIPLSQSVPYGVYVAGILYNSQESIVTISQDLSGVDLSSQSGAQQSITKFGLGPYQDDITKIL